MTRGHAWRWAALALIAVIAALVASFNSGERVALNLGFTILYRLPLVPLIFVAFLAGMVTMFLVGLRHDLRVRRALREAGFGEAADTTRMTRRWEEPAVPHLDGEVSPEVETAPGPRLDPPASAPASDEPPGRSSEAEPPPRYPP